MVSMPTVETNDRFLSLARGVRQAGHILSRLCLSLAALALLVVIIISFSNVILRYVFLRPIAWAEELMLFLMIFSVYTGAVSVAWEQRHIRLEGIRNAAPPKLRRAVGIISALVLIVILAPIIYSSSTVVALLQEMGQTSDAMQAPMWVPQAVVPIALAFIALIALVRIFLPESEIEPHAPDAVV
jgi:TRAP-type C4-dicarboxylate transport system permease small subunit